MTRAIVRRIDVGAWSRGPAGWPVRTASLDAITKDLRVSDHRLSFWGWDGSNQYLLLDLAIASAVALHSLDKIEVVWIEFKETRGARLHNNTVDNPVRSVRSEHVDLTFETREAIFGVADQIKEAIVAERVRVFDRKTILDRVNRLYKEGTLSEKGCGNWIHGVVHAQS